MFLQINLDASFMNETNVQSTAARNFFPGQQIQHARPIKLNGPVHVLCKILDKIAASATEEKLSELLLNTKEAIKLRISLE